MKHAFMVETKTNGRSLPKGWQWVKVEDICILGRGRVISRIDIKNNPGPYPVYSSQTQNQGAFGYLATYDFDGEYCTWTTDGANAGTVFYRNGKFNCTNVCGTLKAKTDDVAMTYLAYALGFVAKDHVFIASGNPKLMNNVFAKIEIPLPPLDEQRRIASRLNEQLAAVESARKAAEEQLSLANTLINAYLKESLLSRLKRIKLEAGLIEVKNGIGETWDTYPVLGTTRDGVAPAKEKVGKKPGRYKLVEPGTIFYNPMRINIGSIGMLDEGEESGITSPDYVVFNSIKGVIHPRWFYYWFRSPYGETFIKTLARGAVRERIMFTRLALAELEIPSYEVQSEIAEKLKNVKQLKISIESQLDEINRLPASLLREAFEGRG